MTLIKRILVVLLIMPAFVGAQVYEIGTTDADTCSADWAGLGNIIIANAFITADVASQVADSGWVYYDYGGTSGDSATMCIYNNLNKTPTDRVAYGDTVIQTFYGCQHMTVMFGQEAIVQDDSVWLALFVFGVVADCRAKRGTAGGIYYEATPSGADDPWDTGNDSYDGTYALSFRLFTSVAAAEGGQVIIISNKEDEDTPFYANGSWTNETGYYYSHIVTQFDIFSH